MKRKHISLLLFILALGIFVYQQFIQKNTASEKKPAPIVVQDSSLATPSGQSLGTQISRATVTKVIDGDTIEINTGQKVRYIGMDTPEIHHPKKPVQCYGYIARDKNRELVEGKSVFLEKDVSEIDRYGRLLRYVYLPLNESSTEAVFINDLLVRQGYAHAVTFPPDVRHQDRFLEAQTEAREKNLGLWKACQ